MYPNHIALLTTYRASIRPCNKSVAVSYSSIYSFKDRRLFWAHTAGAGREKEALQKHLSEVASTSASFAAAFDRDEEASVAGYLHDFGKYGSLFQRRLQGLETGIDHWSPGAWECLRRYGEHGIAAALAIEGHHVGLQTYPGAELGERLNPRRLFARHPLGLRLSETEAAFSYLSSRMEGDGLRLPGQLQSVVARRLGREPAAFMMDVRMLFSALVDADFLCTETHFKGAARPVQPDLAPATALDSLLAYLQWLRSQSTASQSVNFLREQLRGSCAEAANCPVGVFTLTAPTGLGKTLAMLEFALRHARKHSLRRIVTVLPFLSVLDQTVATYRKALGDEFGNSVLEHHSLARDSSRECDADRERERLAENWDSPLIITTNVQLLESIFSNRPSRCRKLHRLAGSVILLDEVQSLPAALAVPTLATLAHLSAQYKCSIVLATATQPAFERLDPAVLPLCTVGWRPREIVSEARTLFEQTRRVSTTLLKECVSWEVLAEKFRLSEGPKQTLAIVNTRKQAQQFVAALRALGEAPHHLSAAMCAAHRRRAINLVKQTLHEGGDCLLVATQCVEAGVDLDFPIVWRAIAPLDSLAQAAGRCNRNGRSDKGLFYVFEPEVAAYPTRSYRQAANLCRSILREQLAEGGVVDAPELMFEYFSKLYDLRGTVTEQSKLIEAIRDRDFPQVALLYRLIDEDVVNVVVPFDLEHFQSLRTLARERGISREWIRDARLHSVNVYASEQDKLPLEPVRLPKGEDSGDWWLLSDQSFYDPTFGLTTEP